MKMALTSTVSYNTSTGFTFSTTVLGVTSGTFTLVATAATSSFNETFDTSTGFTYSATAADFSAGSISQVSPHPASTTFNHNMDTLTADWGDGTLTALTSTGLTITGSYFEFNRTSSSYVIYNSTASVNALSTQGCVRVHYTPLFNGSPTFQSLRIFRISPLNDGLGSANNNLIRFSHLSNGNLEFSIYNQSGGASITVLTALSATSGQTYELEANFNTASNVHQMFIDGVQIGATLTTVLTRDTGMDRLQLNVTSGIANDFYRVNLVQTFSAVQHTANYSSPSASFGSKYTASSVTLPEFDHGSAFIGTLTSMTITSSGDVRFSLNLDQLGTYVYHDGTGWTTSSGTFAQANTLAEVNTNIAALATNDDQYLQVKAHFGSTNTQGVLSNLTVNYNNQALYSTSNPVILYNATTLADGLSGFSVSSTATGSDAIKFSLEIDGTDKYFDGTGWTTSAGTYAEANLASIINTNASSLDLSSGASIRIKAYLHSDDSKTTPTLISASLSYDFFPTEPAAPTECVLSGFMKDILGLTQTTGTLVITNANHFFYGNTLVRPTIYNASITSSGFFEVSIIETTSISTTTTYPMKFEVKYVNSAGKNKTFTLGSALIPNTTTAELSSLSFS